MTQKRSEKDPIDKHVGGRVRMRRMMLGISQSGLGDAFEKALFIYPNEHLELRNGAQIILKSRETSETKP